VLIRIIATSGERAAGPIHDRTRACPGDDSVRVLLEWIPEPRDEMSARAHGRVADRDVHGDSGERSCRAYNQEIVGRVAARNAHPLPLRLRIRLAR